MRFDVFALGRASRPPRRTSTRVRGMVRRPLRSRFWRSGRIVRVRTSNTSGVIRMIPRFSRGGRRVRGGTILPERHFSRSAGASEPMGADRGAAGPAGGSLPGGARFFSGRAGVLHIGRGGGRGSIVGFPRDSGVLARMSVFSGRAPMCREGPSAHGRISTALSAGEFPRDSADPSPAGPGRMCSTAPARPMPRIRARRPRPDTADTTPTSPRRPGSAPSLPTGPRRAWLAHRRAPTLAAGAAGEPPRGAVAPAASPTRSH